LLTTVTLPARLPVEAGANVTLNEVDWPAARLSGSAMEEVVKPAPLALICEMETPEFPVFEIVTLWLALVPVARLPKASDAGETESCKMLEMPVPPSGTTSGEFGALLMSVMLPEKVLAEAGTNPTLKEAEPPGATESGKASPDGLNPVPAREACVTLRVVVPGFRMVSVCVLVTPTVTLPKLMLVGITVICGCTPVPLRETTAGEFVAVLTTLMFPDTAPVASGENFAVSGRLWPAESVTAPGNPVTLNPVPAAATCEMLTLPVPVFVIANACDAELPTRVLPKVRPLRLGESK